MFFVQSLVNHIILNGRKSEKLIKETSDRCLGCISVAVSPVGKEGILILTLERQKGVVPAHLRIPRYHFTSGEYAWEHSNVSYWACKIDVMLSAQTTHLLKLPICPNTRTRGTQTNTQRFLSSVSFNWNTGCDDIIYIIMSNSQISEEETRGII